MIKPNSTRQKVAKLLNLDQRMRDDNRYLILKMWEGGGLILTKEQRAIYMGLPSPDVITRRRREFNTTFPPSPAILEKRYKHYRAFTDEYSNYGWLKKILRRRGL